MRRVPSSAERTALLCDRPLPGGALLTIAAHAQMRETCTNSPPSREREFVQQPMLGRRDFVTRHPRPSTIDSASVTN